MWVRGLKLGGLSGERVAENVAPRVGAWIETSLIANFFTPVASHPVWVRGLKLSLRAAQAKQKLSHPVWVRGLKLTKFVAFQALRFVAPRVGAWIETSDFSINTVTNTSRTPCGCVD